MPKQYRCDGCHSVEHGSPFNLCPHCALDFERIKDLANVLRKQLGRWELNITDTVKAAYNRAIARIDELKGK